MNSWTIGKKLMTGFGVMLALTLGLSYYSLTAIERLGGALAANTARTMDLVGTVRLGLREMVEQAKSAQLTYVVSHIKRLEGEGAKAAASGMECATCHTMEGFENNGREFAGMAARVRDQVADCVPRLPIRLGKSRSRRLKPVYPSGVRSTKSFFATSNEMTTRRRMA